jgi:hypothetical protein
MILVLFIALAYNVYPLLPSNLYLFLFKLIACFKFGLAFYQLLQYSYLINFTF